MLKLDSNFQYNFVTYRLCNRLEIKFRSTKSNISNIKSLINFIIGKIQISISFKCNKFTILCLKKLYRYTEFPFSEKQIKNITHKLGDP